jgi:NitT/TauT family transport system substrate-binding protein
MTGTPVPQLPRSKQPKDRAHNVVGPQMKGSHMNLHKRQTTTASMVALVLALAACSGAGPSTTSSGATKGLTPFGFQLNNPSNGSNAAFASAIEQGYYKSLGLDVKIDVGTGSSVTAQMVAAGRGNVGYADSAATTQLISQGAPLVVLATILQSNPNEVIALKESGITSIADLKGKTVGTPVPSSQATMLPLFLSANGLSKNDVKLVNLAPTSLVQSLLQHKVDAILGSVDTYQVQLQQQYKGEIFTAMFADHGVATVSTSIFANKDWAAKNANAVKAFVAGSLKGWQFASTNPTASAEDLKKHWGAANIDKASLQELQATLDANLLCAGGAKFVGRAEPAQWTKTQDLLSSVGLLPKGVSPTTYYTYDYLPPQSALQACPIK